MRMKQQEFSLQFWFLSMVLVLLGIISIATLVLMVDQTRHAIQSTLQNTQESVMAHNHPIQIIEDMESIVLSLLSIMIIILLVGSYIVSQWIREVQLRETSLQSELIKNREAMEQAERKSMNKSLAFANASHDLRTSIMAIMGLIELCHEDAPQNSDLSRNISWMAGCASKLLGMLNSILDASKVEAGKMLLEEVEFDIAEVLEDSANICHVLSLKKGVEVIWDPCDGSVLRSSNVKGDCNRLKQILDNILSNAVKFTSDGHIVIRAWCKKPNIEKFKKSRKHGFQFLNMFSPMFKRPSKEEDTVSNFGELSHIHHDPYAMEFIFEIDDTGLGIPKEMRASVFENYIQVNDSAHEGHGGTGLGLGIVQSFVRLMGGEIKIQDKDPGEKGTCFRFYIFLKSNDLLRNSLQEDRNPTIQVPSQMPMQNSSETNSEHLRNYTKIHSSDQAMVFKKGFQLEGIQCIHFIQGDETRRVVKEWMVSLGIEVCEVYDSKLLLNELEKIKLRTSESIDFASGTVSFNRESSQNSIISQESSYESEQALPLTLSDLHKKNSSKHLRSSINHVPAYVLVIIDLSCKDIHVVCSILKDFAKRFSNNHYKTVWLANESSSGVDLKGDKYIPCDLILHKPLHGSRLCELLKLLQSFGDEIGSHSSDKMSEDKLKGVQHLTEASSYMAAEKNLVKSISLESIEQRPTSSYNGDDSKPLSGRRILLVEDSPILRLVASKLLSGLGTTVELSSDGLEALNLVKNALHQATHAQDGSIKETYERFSYSLILMDCEMPVMNGCESTRRIREEEQLYGYHVPIIALTAHASSDETSKAILAGMDFCLNKPLETGALLKAIRTFCHN